MRPRKRYLKGNRGTEGPTSLFFFDTESYEPEELPSGHRREMSLRLWTACYVRREGLTYREPIWHRGKTARGFWDLVESYNTWSRPLWAFAHNLGHDLTQLCFWDELERKRWTPGPLTIPGDAKTGRKERTWRGRLFLEGRPTFCVVRGARGTLKLIDTSNYWPTALAKVGQRAGLPKLEMPAWSASDEEWFHYCQRDTDVCRVALCSLLTWWLKEDCGVFQMTAPSLALNHFRHTSRMKDHPNEPVNIVLEDESPARPLERGAYLGGMIEPFYVGKVAEPVRKVDCNGLYLYVMANELFPRKRVREWLSPNPGRLLNMMSAYGAAADVLIDTGTSDRTYPLKHEGVQVHACGRFWTTLCGAELHRALWRGDVERVGEAHLYSLAPLFKRWARYWSDRKMDARRRDDRGEEEFAKLIGVSLAGKFGQKGEWWIDDPTRAPRKQWGQSVTIDDVRKKVVHYRYVAGFTQRKVPGDEPANGFPIISAYVTSYAREYMKRAFRALPPKSLLYCGTDSLIVTEPGYQALLKGDWIHPEEAGKFRLEGTYESAEICGPNWYRVGDRWAVSGLHGRARPGPDGKMVVEVWDQLPSLLQQNPGGRCGINRVLLGEMKPTHKNAPIGDGYRRPFRLAPDADFTDRPPRLTDRYVRRQF